MATGRHRFRLTPRQRITAILATLAIVVGLPIAMTTAAASAAWASSPSIGAAGVQNTCSRADYSCTSGGYTGSEPWGYYTRYGSRDAAGRLHNCTTYVAFRLAQNGVARPGWYANANNWAASARAAHVPVDGNPAKGAIAQWTSGVGHVAYVESVSANAIDLTDDMYGVNKTNHWRITRGSPSWPNNFIHFKDLGDSAPAPQPVPSPTPTRPVFTVMNTSETPPDGVWFRDNPAVSAPRLNGYGVYKSDRVQLQCYGWGPGVGAYNDRLWYRSANLTRPSAPGRPNVGWLNAHYINDGKAANVIDAGVPAC